MSEKKNYSIRLGLKQLNQVVVTNIKGKAGNSVPVVIIPIEPNGIFVGEKDVYLNLSAFSVQNSQYGNSHLIKRSLTEEENERLSEDEKHSMPIVGNMREIKLKGTKPEEVKGEISTEAIVDDLPF